MKKKTKSERDILMEEQPEKWNFILYYIISYSWYIIMSKVWKTSTYLS
jgi:hypothetical protein